MGTFGMSYKKSGRFLVGIEGDKMIKKALLVLALSFFLFMTSSWAQTQSTPVSRGGEVAIMPFAILDDSANTIPLYYKMIAEVDNLGVFFTRRISPAEYPELVALSPDMPPEMRYLNNSPYALTGEFYMDTDDYQHLQIWLWNSFGSLLYTDEMVSESYEESIEYMPLLVRWIFSHVPADNFIPATDRTARTRTSPVVATNNTVVIAAENTPTYVVENKVITGEERRLPMERFYLGLRGGASFNTYTIPQAVWRYESGRNRRVSYEAALFAEFKAFRFLSFQAEVVFAQDFFTAKEIIPSAASQVDTFRAMSLSFPLLIKVPISFKFFDISPYAGAYFTLPLGKVDEKADGSVSSSSAYTVKPPVGFSLGVDMGYLLGPGRLLLDLRYNRNIGITRIQRTGGLQYMKDAIGLTLGYKFILWK
jgi:hypothetical protein